MSEKNLKKVGDIMKDLGFNADAPDSAKEAFIRHLIKASTGTIVFPRGTTPIKPIAQMSFDFDSTDDDKKAM